MHTGIYGTYFATLEHALEVAERISLSVATFVEPSRLTGFLCANAKEAVLFFLRFAGSQRCPVQDPDVFLMIAPVGSDEVQDWSKETSMEGTLIEMVAVEFCSSIDQRRFEAAL